MYVMTILSQYLQESTWLLHFRRDFVCFFTGEAANRDLVIAEMDQKRFTQYPILEA